MPILLNRTEHYRYLANEHRRLASNDSFTEARSYHLLMAKNFNTLAESAGVEDNTGPRTANCQFNRSDLRDRFSRRPRTFREGAEPSLRTPRRAVLGHTERQDEQRSRQSIRLIDAVAPKQESEPAVNAFGVAVIS